MGDRNDEGENIVGTATAFDLAIVNTFFEKKVNQFVTYNSGGRDSMRDFLMCRRCHLKEVMNCKVVNGEAVAAQHLVLVTYWEIHPGKKRNTEPATPRIKWWRLKEYNLKAQFREKMNGRLTQGISRNEVKVAISRMKNAKAREIDWIPVEVWKCLVEEGIGMLGDLMQGIYEQEKIPTEWRDSVMIPIYKENGDIQDCGNYRGIKLMSHTMKIWERVMERRHMEETTIGYEQFCFIPGIGMSDAIFAVRQLMEKHLEKQTGLHIYRHRKAVR